MARDEPAMPVFNHDAFARGGHPRKPRLSDAAERNTPTSPKFIYYATYSVRKDRLMPAYITILATGRGIRRSGSTDFQVGSANGAMTSSPWGGPFALLLKPIKLTSATNKLLDQVSSDGCPYSTMWVARPPAPRFPTKHGCGCDMVRGRKCFPAKPPRSPSKGFPLTWTLTTPAGARTLDVWKRPASGCSRQSTRRDRRIFQPYGRVWQRQQTRLYRSSDHPAHTKRVPCQAALEPSLTNASHRPG